MKKDSDHWKTNFSLVTVDFHRVYFTEVNSFVAELIRDYEFDIKIHVMMDANYSYM